TGFVALAPVQGADGCSFHQNGAQNVNTSFVNFTGSAVGQVFDNSSEISFLLKSAHSYQERKALTTPNIRGVFEVFDSSTSMYFFGIQTISTGDLQFNYTAGGYAAAYTVPSGQQDAIFGKDVVAKIRIKWSPTGF